MKWSLLGFSLLMVTHGPAFAQKKIQLSSPDNRITFSFGLTSSLPTYSVSYQRKTLIENSEIGLSFNQKNFEAGEIAKPAYRQGIEEYELVVGKTKKVKEPYREVTIPLKDLARKAQVNLTVRIFNGGIGLRFEFITGYGQDSLVLTDERMNFKFPMGTVVRFLPLPNYTSSHEGFYQTTPLNLLKEGSLMDMPALFELPGHLYCAVTEAALVDYAGMYLTKTDGVLRSILSPLPGQTSIKVKAKFPHQSPWRVMLISDRIGELIESNVITNLNEPNAIQDVGWLKPGKTTFPWWVGNVLPDTLNAPGNNFVTQQYYIDFCARNGIEYHSVVEYGLHQWYVDDGISFMPGPHSDPTKAVPGLDMKQVCDYAKSKGVGVRVWVHWAALYPKLDSAFIQYEKWGLSGMMVDFMDRDDQLMVNIQNEILKKAAQHHLHIQFHGAYKPTGLHRTYPNELTREGTLNYEINKWDKKGLSPDHDIMIPFTRMLAGSTDYHLGGFRAVPTKEFRQQYTRPLMLGTRAHMLAMYVVLENYLGMVCDYPEAYEGQPGFDFIREVPTVWDETKVLDAKVGEFIVVARRKGKDWFVGAITNQQPRTLDVRMNFLPPGNYVGTIYRDENDSSVKPNNINITGKRLTPLDNIAAQLGSGGGFAMHIKQK
jgi:alpha-glucosidase